MGDIDPQRTTASESHASTQPNDVQRAAVPPNATAPAERPRKKRGWRIFRWTLLVLLLVVVGLGVIVYLNLNAIVERTVEKQATASTNLQTDLAGARLSLFGGSLELNRTQVASPEGFAAPHMLTLEDADVSVSFNELRSDPVRVRSITLEEPKLVIERGPEGLNFKVASELMPKTEPQQDPLKLIIDDLTIKEASVIVRPNLPGLAEEIVVPIPSITMQNIGTGEGAENGAAIKDVLMQVVTVMAAKASGSGSLPKEFQDLLNLDLKEVTAQLGEEARRRVAEAVPGELGQALGDIVADPDALIKDPGGAIEKGLEDAVGGLLGKDKDGDRPRKQDEDATDETPEKSLKDLIPKGRDKKSSDRQP